MRVSKRDIYTRKHGIASIRFEDQQMTSSAGLVVFLDLFDRLDLKGKLKDALAHMEQWRAYAYSTVVELLIVHVLLGCQKLREVEYYRDDPMVQLLLGLKRLPGVSTLSRMLREFDERSVEQSQELIRRMVVDRLLAEGVRRMTFDFDGSVQSTRRHAEGTAVGYNKKKKGARSYYPLFCTVAQTGQVFDVLHRTGNVHDSNGAQAFAKRCIAYLRRYMPTVTIEVRMDSAFFSDAMIQTLEEAGVEYTISVPFLRSAKLKEFVNKRRVWIPLELGAAYFQKQWKPESWQRKARFIFVRKEVAVQRKGPIQLDLFEPTDFSYEYKVIVTNKRAMARSVAKYHEGRGYQESIFGEMKSQGAMEYIPVRSWVGNKIYLLCNLLAHNLVRELQMQAGAPTRGTTAKRSPLWIFEGLEVIRRTVILRAGRLTNPGGVRTLTLSANKAVQKTILRFLAAA